MATEKDPKGFEISLDELEMDKTRQEKDRKEIEQLIFESMEPQLVDFRKTFFKAHPDYLTGWRETVRKGLDTCYSSIKDIGKQDFDAFRAVIQWATEYADAIDQEPPAVLGRLLEHGKLLAGYTGKAFSGPIDDAIMFYTGAAERALDTLYETGSKEEFQKTLEKNTAQAFEQNKEFFDNMTMLSGEISEHLSSIMNDMLRPVFDELVAYSERLEEAAKAPEFEGKPLKEIYDESLDENGEVIPGSPFDRLHNLAQAPEKKLPVIRAAKADKLKYSHDAVTLALQGVKDAATDGQMTLSANSLPGTKNTISIGVDFTALKEIGEDRTDIDRAGIKQKITDYDLLAASAVGSIWLNDGGRRPHSTTTTLEQIYKTMGGKTSPNTQQTKALLTSLLKSNCVVIAIDNSAEVERGKAKYKKRTIYGTLIDAIFDVEANINGSVTDMAVTITRGALITEFAEERGQTVTIDRKCLQVLTLKDGDIRIKTVLLNAIVMVLNNKSKQKYSNELTFDTIFQKAGFKGKKSRGVEKVEKVLAHYKKTKVQAGFRDYMILSDRIIINPTKDQWKRLGQ